MHESLSNKINQIPIYKNKPELVGEYNNLDKIDFYREKANFTMESSKAAAIERIRENSLKAAQSESKIIE